MGCFAVQFANPGWLAGGFALVVFVLGCLLWQRRLCADAKRWAGASRPISQARSIGFGGATLALLILALAGPRWGKVVDPGWLRGRDLVIVLDLSASMAADDPKIPQRGTVTRFQVAQVAVGEMLQRMEERGGHRVGLVAFASRAVVLCPLTADLAHVRQRVEQLSVEFPPDGTLFDSEQPTPSGTRIGAGIAAAVDLLDPQFRGYRDVLLLSDGDDPARDSEEQAGIAAARGADVPVHVVALGDAEAGATLRQRDGSPRLQDGKPVVSRMKPESLRAIAEQTGGEWLEIGIREPQLGQWFVQTLENRPSRTLAAEDLPQPRDQSPWFLGGAIMTAILAQWPHRTDPKPPIAAPA
ncbi:VWA domain-containing protein [Tuwongella immobilis]|uniref:VWFA domain-containing protein n=1 Tax=Tuwongella immobilis TaxID=692036 RepID=A0A6C2YKH1_9BACT|nr:VWA domain-containing protein [Tuwongella immobilis]VIP01877.1 Uncharacterized protein OS=Candidatus Entotheonella sp. TSY1 GN=ETSY1_32190 PE=4 SV=1: VWA_2 [Tuwongella immobilis]VTR99719.1 Uncharacterized protein OS=Candidatus Entotheonella sp. TSY1 GN=ETSY1_32190 PE=4 SV=1: VWA_2 [Tuwongella immobilis]